MKTQKTIFLLPLILAASLIGGCATPPPYVPDPVARAQVMPIQARNFLKTFRGGNFNKHGWENGVPVYNLHVSNKSLVLVRRSDNRSYIFPLKDLNLSVDTRFGEVVINGYSLWDIGNIGTPGLGGIAPDPDDLAYAKQLALAIYVLKDKASREDDPQGEAVFAKAAKAYRDAAVKPIFPEEARKFKVQAEGALNDKKFEDAADLYGEALNIAPWWPEGHFNRALVLAEIGDYELAILEMKHYLTLVPNAPDAHAAQNKIYDWERKAGK